MQEIIKDKVILILAILTAIFFVGTVGSCSNASRLKLSRDKEMTSRLDLEEKISKFMQEKQTIDGKLNSLTQELEKIKAEHEIGKKALLQEQLVTQSLKEQLEKVTKLNAQLQEDLKEALVTKSTKKQ